MDIELLQSKSLSDLREIAKLAGVKSVTTYRKAELLEKLVNMAKQADEEERMRDERMESEAMEAAFNVTAVQAAVPEQSAEEPTPAPKKRRGRPPKKRPEEQAEAKAEQAKGAEQAPTEAPAEQTEKKTEKKTRALK